MSLNDRTYAVALSNAALPAVIALVLSILSVFRFSLAERKNEIQKEEKVPLRTPIRRAPRKSCKL
jgi:hypothetical protein